MTPLIPEQVDYRLNPNARNQDLDGGHDDPRANPASGGDFQSPGLDLGFSTVDLPGEAHQYNLLGNAQQIGIDGWSNDSLDGLSPSQRAARASASDV